MIVVPINPLLQRGYDPRSDYKHIQSAVANADERDVMRALKARARKKNAVRSFAVAQLYDQRCEALELMLQQAEKPSRNTQNWFYNFEDQIQFIKTEQERYHNRVIDSVPHNVDLLRSRLINYDPCAHAPRRRGRRVSGARKGSNSRVTISF